ncbi:unnamed protein product [Urochloa decumbens]|uniref:NADP-dependent oxidoreductase domain-containing protein n=1 Tax=Urochloa decumbens TaxID=240449 RepID=A0ABC9CQD3_9POAL
MAGKVAAAPAVALSSGHQMPSVGLGVWRMEKPAIRSLIHSALRIGYRHLDCAADYQNEAEVGDALVEAFQTGLVKREDLFITTKLWNSDHGHVIEACKDSLKKLQVDYLDLYLVHFPVATRHTGVGTTSSALGDDGVLDIDTTISLETTWHAMEELVSMGLVRSIGISNYDIFLTRDCLAYAKIKPAVNQIETHPYFQRDSLVKFCQKHGICVTAHTPLGGSTANTEWFGSVSCLDDPVIKVVVIPDLHYCNTLSSMFNNYIAFWYLAISIRVTTQSANLVATIHRAWLGNTARHQRSWSCGGVSRGTRW